MKKSPNAPSFQAVAVAAFLFLTTYAAQAQTAFRLTQAPLTGAKPATRTTDGEPATIALNSNQNFTTFNDTTPGLEGDTPPDEVILGETMNSSGDTIVSIYRAMIYLGYEGKAANLSAEIQANILQAASISKLPAGTKIVKKTVSENISTLTFTLVDGRIFIATITRATVKQQKGNKKIEVVSYTAEFAEVVKPVAYFEGSTNNPLNFSAPANDTKLIPITSLGLPTALRAAAVQLGLNLTDNEAVVSRVSSAITGKYFPGGIPGDPLHPTTLQAGFTTREGVFYIQVTVPQAPKIEKTSVPQPAKTVKVNGKLTKVPQPDKIKTTKIPQPDLVYYFTTDIAGNVMNAQGELIN